MAEVKTGDVVRMKGQDTKMTVATEGKDWVKCQWFDTAGELHTREFKVALLEKV